MTEIKKTVKDGRQSYIRKSAWLKSAAVGFAVFLFFAVSFLFFLGNCIG